VKQNSIYYSTDKKGDPIGLLFLLRSQGDFSKLSLGAGRVKQCPPSARGGRCRSLLVYYSATFQPKADQPLADGGLACEPKGVQNLPKVVDTKKPRSFDLGFLCLRPYIGGFRTACMELVA